MKARLRIAKRGACLYDGVHDIIDRDSFGSAFSEAWRKVREKRLEETTSMGELAEILNDEVLDQLQGADIRLEKIE